MRGLISVVIVAVTVVFQLTVVDRIAFPGGSGPDLVLVMVAALALASGPLAGAMIGFWAGLALDVAPPGSHFTGQDALVFCLLGYACGMLTDRSSGDSMSEPGHSALFEIMVTAAGAICGEALVALLGVMLSDPQVTWSAITHVLPVAVAYDVLLCPFVLYAAAVAWRLAGARGSGARVGWSSGRAVPVTGAAQGAVRRAAVGSAPRLRLADARRSYHGGTYGPGASRGPGWGRDPGLGAAFATGGSPRLRFGSRRHEGVLGGSMLGGSMLGGSGAGSGVGGSALRTAAFGHSHLGRSLLGGSVFSRPPAVGLTGKGSTFGRSAPLGRSSPLRHRNQFKRPSQFKRPGQFKSTSKLSTSRRGRKALRGPKSLSATPRFSRSRRLFAPPRTAGRSKSPSRGWLRSQGRSRGLARGLSSAGGRRRWRPSRRRSGGYR